MANDKKGDPTDPKNQVISSSPLADQIPKEISKMLEGGAKARAATDLECALACFDMDIGYARSYQEEPRCQLQSSSYYINI
jgi:hypothetical protein